LNLVPQMGKRTLVIARRGFLRNSLARGIEIEAFSMMVETVKRNRTM